jgi:hypothetical protein
VRHTDTRLSSEASAGYFWRMRETLAVQRKPRPLDGCPTFAPSVRGPKTTGDRRKPIKRSLSTKPLERSPKNSPQKKNPEGYGLQPARKCIHRGPALAAEGSMFPLSNVIIRRTRHIHDSICDGGAPYSRSREREANTSAREVLPLRTSLNSDSTSIRPALCASYIPATNRA